MMKRFALPAFALLSSLTASAQAPTITALSPVRNAVAAPRAAPVAVTFSQPMQNTAATQQAVRVFSQQRGGLMFGTQGGIATVSGNTISFDPANDFKPGETVYVTTTAGATAANGAPLAAGHVHQFTTEVGGTGRGTFVAPTINPEVSVGLHPYSVAVGDVDSDGDLDLLTANVFNSTVSVRLNDGLGSFSGTTEVSVGAEPQAVALGDIDGDGDLDMLVVNAASFGPGANTVSVRLNDGSGSFSGTQNVSAGTYLTSLGASDVDGDGDLDLLVANSIGTVNVRLNDGAGTFSGTSTVGVGRGPVSVATGDVDGDGDLDLLTANVNSGSVSVRLNDGAGSFSGSQDVRVGNFPYGVALGDVDGDGNLDLLAVNRNALGTVSMRLNNGLGAFSGTTNINMGANSRSLALGDVDGDGDLDLLAANDSVGASTVSVRLNNGAGSFSGTTEIVVGSGPLDMAMGDADGDGDLDLFTANGSANTVSVRLNGGTGPTLATAPALAEAAPDVYPNPAPDGLFTIRATLPGARYTVLDAVGRTVTTDALTGSETALDLRHQPAGLYLLRLTSSDGRTVTRRLVR